MKCYDLAVIDDLNPTWIDTPDGVEEVAAACASEGRFALDTEADSLHSYFHKVCLIQVSADGRHFLIDPLAIEREALDPLWRVVEDPLATVVMHGADYDVRVLDRDFGTHVGGLEDTQIMAQLLGEEKTGLGHLLERDFGLALNKKYQRADWGRRPLKPELLAYAAADTAFLKDLRERLRDRLKKLGRWDWAAEEFGRLAVVRHVSVDPDPLMFERVKGARALKGAARDRIFDLYWWRDAEAQRLDLPPFKVLGNKPMIELAVKPPESARELGVVPGLGHRFVRRWGADVMKHLRRPLAAPPRVRNHHSPGPTAAERRRIEGLTVVRDEIAAELGLQPGLVCPKALLLSMATSPQGAAGMADSGLTGWRFQLLSERFATAISEARRAESKEK